MRFRIMAEEMSNAEILVVLKMIHPYVIVKEIIRNKKSNSIEVRYSFPGEPDYIVRRIDFLPDDVYFLSNESVPKEIHIGEGNKLYQYRQFMIAKGYSEFWLDNPYVEN